MRTAGLVWLGLVAATGGQAGSAAVTENNERGSGVATDPMRLRVVPDAIAGPLGARCLDGSPPSMYVRLGPNNATEWVLFLEGGGWCFGPTPAATLASCAGRSRSGGGSSKHNPPVAADYGGVLSADAGINQRFHQFNHVFLKYCDGSSFGGLNPAPQSSGGTQIHLRGRACFDALVADLQANFGMANASEVVLSGGSAGGLAVFYQLDHLAELLGPGVMLTGFPDAGFFLDAPTLAGEYWYREQFQAADSVWNVTGANGTNAACLAGTARADWWRCLMAEYLAEFLVTPIFIMNSAYDGYQLPQILKSGCSLDLAKPGCCNASQLRPIQAYHAAVGQRVMQAVKANRSPSASGAYIDNCWVHEQNVDYCHGQSSPNCVGWSPAEPGSLKWGYSTAVWVERFQRSYTPQQAFSAYYDSRKAGRLPAYCGADEASCWAMIDTKTYPTNPTCVFRG